ncbi:MAG: response regulator [Pirellulales bacterium]|nr:response regulator [Pirellulales bacterium]
MKRILILDDDQRMLDALRRTLHRQTEDWAVTFLRRPEAALKALQNTPYDAVVTDIRMPGIDGLELLDRIRQCEQTRNIPVVVLTGVNDRDLKAKALERGAADLLNKPVEASQLIARLRNVLETKTYQDNLRATNSLLNEKVQQQSTDLAQTRMSIICRLGMAAEFRDEDTGNHVIRVGCYSRAIATELGMPRPFLEMLLLAAPLHDIGKIGIPDSVLLKPGPLDDDEWIVMKRHCEIGECILRDQSKVVVPLIDWYSTKQSTLKNVLDNRDPVLDMAATIALTHHEKWGGGGYPRGLAGEAIPLESRIVAAADMFDALTSNRPYRPARPEEEALSIMENTVGSHLDPKVYDAFIRALPEIRAIRDRFSDDVALFPTVEGASR